MARSSIVMICKNIKFDRDNLNVLTYSEQQILTLCQQNAVRTATNYSFVGGHNTNTIVVNFSYSECLSCNYVAFQNKDYNLKWYFAFIDTVEYVSDGATKIHFTVDIFHTWWSYWDAKQCFVVREHVNDDTVGLHTVPEGLATGDYICDSRINLGSYATSSYICIGVTEVPDEIPLNVNNTRYNGIFSGIKLLLFETPLAGSNFIRAMDKLGKGSAVINIFLIPQALCGSVTFTTYTVEGVTFQTAPVPYSDTVNVLETVNNITSPQTIDGYSPSNKKLLCYPYNYFYITNNVGSDVIFKYEDFINNTAGFKILGSITVGCSIKVVPLNYKKLADTNSTTNSYNYGIVSAKYPVCSWVSDSYTNWLTQNSINIAGIKIDPNTASNITNIGSMLVGTALMIGTGGAGAMLGAGMMLSGASGMFENMQEQYQRDLVPPQSKGNVSSGDVTYSSGNMLTPLYKMQIRQEYAISIDQYFKKYGYKVNRLKLPNQTGRTYFNYVEIGKGELLCYQKNNVVAIPPQDLIQLNKLYQRGITLWHDYTNFGDFSVTNGIISQNNS